MDYSTARSPIKTIATRVSSVFAFLLIVISISIVCVFASAEEVFADGEITTAEELSRAFRNGGEYTLAADIHQDDGFTLDGKSLELDFNGHTITTGVSNCTMMNKVIGYTVRYELRVRSLMEENWF